MASQDVEGGKTRPPTIDDLAAICKKLGMDINLQNRNLISDISEMKIDKRIFAFIEIGFVILSGFIMSIAMKWLGIQFFALPHLTFIFTAIFFRSIVSDWRPQDYGFKFYDIAYQIKLGLFIWTINQSYHSLLHVLSPLFQLEKLGAMVFNIKTFDSLLDKIFKIGLFKAGVIETLRYFSYIQGLLMEVFNPALGSFMAFVYFGTSHMRIMNLITLPVSFLFVYFYRTYKLIIPVIIFHMLGDSVSFIQIYLSYKGLYLYNVVVFIMLIFILRIFRKEIKDILVKIGAVIREDYFWLWDNKFRAISLSLILPAWLHLLLYLT